MANSVIRPGAGSPGWSRRSVLQAGAALGAASALGGGVARADDVVELTYWAWTPGDPDMVAAFMKAFPNIKINYQNVGQGGPHYQKLRDALTAGTGIPDVAQMEFNSIPSFRALNALADMGAAGANSIKDKFVDWTWKAASDGDKVYGIPWDSGPMGLLYREDVYAKSKVAPPETWDDFAEAALKIAKDSPGSYIANFPAASDAGWTAGVLWQKGWRPFHTDGTNITIKINDPIAKEWAAYWQKLLDAKAIDTGPAWTADWFAAFDSGKVASWVCAAWSPVLMISSMKNSVGKWRAAKMPQWKKGDYVVSNWGGSNFSTFAATKHLKEATAFAMWMGGNLETAKYWNQKQYLFPVVKEVLNDPAVLETKFPFYGDQQVNKIFAEAEAHVDPSFEFAPFQDYVNTHLQDEFAAAIGGKGTLADAFDRVQEAIVAYAKDQGYTVK